MVPMQGGAVSTAKLPADERNVALEPGGALVAAMITGDFDMSGIGTVTHIDGKRVYGWGHPFFGMGGCEFPLMTGYTHMILSRSSISFKMGSPIRTVGVINADVSTCVAGWLDRTPDMLPISTTVMFDGDPAAKTYNVKVVRHRTLTPSFATMALVNSIDQEGDLPDEMTAHLKLKIDVEGRAPDRGQRPVLRLGVLRLEGPASDVRPGERDPANADEQHVREHARQGNRGDNRDFQRPAHRGDRGGRAG